MKPRLTRIVSIDRMRAIEARCFEQLPVAAVMESAGRAVAERVLARLRAKRQTRVLVACGKGNNGADGLVAARWLAQAGADVSVFMTETTGLSELCAANLKLLDRFAVARPKNLALAAASADVVIDALLGIGAREPLKGAYARAVKTLAEHARFIVAVDIPTPGLDVAETITFHATKAEMTQLPLRARCGEIVVADVGIPDALFAEDDGYVIDARFVDRHLPLERAGAGKTNAHKGTFGHVGLIGGGAGKTGAITLAAIAALRAGAGLATILGNAEKRPPEVMTAPITAAKKCTALCVGPGLADALPLDEIKAFAGPVVLDADALNQLSAMHRWNIGKGPRILTPHPLEFARLSGHTVDAVQADRLGTARTAAKESGAIIVLKGANTVVAAPDGRYAVSSVGGRELAKGGSGDVLAGIIAGIAAQRAVTDPFLAACAGVYLHATAASHAATAKASVLASEIAAHLPDAMRAVELRVGA